MAKTNGTVIKILAAVAGLIIVGLTAMQALGVFQGEIKRDVEHIHESIQAAQAEDRSQWIDIDQNTYYRLGDTKDTQILAERIDNQGKRLDNRIENLQTEMQDFASEQRAANKEILNRLPQ